MNTIEAINAFIVDLPTLRPHVRSVATMMQHSIVEVRIRCSEGIVGLSSPFIDATRPALSATPSRPTK